MALISEHPDMTESAAQALRQIVGNDNVISDPQQRAYYSTDLSFRPMEVAALVVRPGSAEELGQVTAYAAREGLPVVARGGGMSYTNTYTPEKPNSILVDMRRMNRIVEINTEDMYVTVECGCTWKTLYEALQAKGVRTPYFGPLSGMYATVGGALSNNSLFLGSGVHRTVADSLLGLRMVLADGTVMRTGSGAHEGGNPFYRHFGPDLTGIFTADTGAFGFKAEATLRLIRTPPSTAYISFSFDTLDQMLEAQTEIARQGVASECYGFDPYYNAGFEKQGITFKEGLSVVGKVARTGGIRGLARAAKMAVTGKNLLKGVKYSLHMTFDAIDDISANSAMEMAAEVCVEKGAVEIENSLPIAFRAAPFGGVRTILLGSEGEIWIPVHGFFPLSKAVAAGRATEKWLAEKKPILEKHNIRTSYLTCFAGAEFVIEPSFYWFDELGPFRLSLIEEEFADKWKSIPADATTRQVVLGLREELRDLFDSLGACHLQLGKYYKYEQVMADKGLWRLLNGVKDVVDPQRRVNPGALGLR
ncbi:MAG TPA: FAD-binding oxidoreductase [Azospirillaceae bacterium]|nr:FAD-binding oxidoreductase [Azospirillaceae bacterium]